MKIFADLQKIFSKSGTDAEIVKKFNQSSTDPILITDQDGKIKEANEQAARLFAIPDPDQMIGKRIFEIISPKELEQTRKLLNESTSFAASIVETADDAIIGESLDGVITSWNKGAENLYGYKAKDIIGKSVEVVYPPELKEDVKKILDRLRKGELIQHFQTVRMSKDARRIPVSLTISPVSDDKGNVIGISAIARDITKEKELDTLKDQFISLTSHALRTPLTAIKGLISMIYQGDYGPLNKNLEKPLGNIALSTERLIKLVNDLLNISRAQTGRLEYKLTNVSIQDLIESVVKNLSPIAKENNIEMIFSKKESAKVQTDQEKTIDILNNLISNALKFTNQGSIEISLKEENEKVVVLVKDTGIGIEAKDQVKLFRRFQQITNVTSKQITGTGLGLYLSKMMAQKMGGDVWLVESMIKKGSTFAYSLPVAESSRAREVKVIIENNSGHS